MRLLAALPTATIIDVAHHITPFSIDEAAYMMRTCVDDFEQGTIHLISVDVDFKKYPNLLACVYKGQIFITADNGLLTLFTPADETVYYKLPYEEMPEGNFFPLKHALVPAAIAIAQKGIEAVGKRIDHVLEKLLEQPLENKDKLRGHILYVNNYNNAITNITRTMFDNVRAGRNFEVVLNYFDSINSISEHYSDVEEGESLCFFNEDGLLEIAVNRAEASQLLGLEKGKRVTVEFFDSNPSSSAAKAPKTGSLL